MRTMKALAMVVIAVCAVAAMTAASAMAAPKFLSTGGALTGKATETQTFATNFGNVECTALTASGTTVASSPEQHATVNYKKCTAFGVSATITLALYLFLANGATHIVKPITVTALGCTLTVKAQTVNTVKYSNSGAEVVLTPEVAGIAYEGVGTLCPGSAKNGTYVGKSQVGVVGGTVKWDA